jgi:DNA polymerase III epsilon subunit family exonuclease
MFYDVFFPPQKEDREDKGVLTLDRVMKYTLQATAPLAEASLVIFDFETTGLDTDNDKIIEIGAIKVDPDGTTAEFSYLINPEQMIPANIVQICGITNDMVKDAPIIEDVLPKFLEFISGSILVAHNAEFDFAFLRRVAKENGYDLIWPCFCTLKMARVLLPDLDTRNLDKLAEHFNLRFESRHRSIGDCKVTHGVLRQFIADPGHSFQVWNDLAPFYVGHS